MEGYFATMLVVTCVGAVFFFYFRGFMGYLLENKGVLGLLAVLTMMAFPCTFTPWLVAGYIGVAEAEVWMFGIIVFVLIIVIIAWKSRDYTINTAKVANTVRKKVRRTKN